MSDDDEIGRFIRRAHHSLKSHRGELRWSPAPDGIRAAMGVTLSSLQRIAETHPDRRDAVESIFTEFQNTT